MSGITDSIFGGGDEQVTSTNSSGYSALPPDLQVYFDSLAAQGMSVTENPAQYFAPMGLTDSELLARQMLDPTMISSNIENYLNPFADYAINDINQQFEGEFGALNQVANEAGAFGSSKYREGQGDIEEARLEAIGSTLGNQYNTAYSQMLGNVNSLLGYGSLERGIDLAQRQALPTALGFQSNLINPLLGAGTSTGYAPQSNNILGEIGSLASGAGALVSAF